ncbi:MAG: hypothetical protein JO161_05110, partial [Planctomycetaceae bacterium]|nr:hypothetical protein [Planctomycetaceae bacterium]
MSTRNGQLTSQLTRHTRDKPCPVCGGWDGARRGQGSRCYGFDSGDYVHCTREEFAGRCTYYPASRTYSHRRCGLCPCGKEHSHDPTANGRPKSTLGTIDRVYKYHDAAGKVLFEAVRFRNPKDFRQRRPVGGGKYAWNLEGIEPVLYHLPLVLSAPPDEPAWIPEGEKDVETLQAAGRLATCNPMGAGKWRDEYAAHLAGRHCLIIPDNDQVGRDHAQQVARSLHGKAASVKVVELPGLPEHGDVSDFLASGGRVEQLDELARKAPEWKPSSNGTHEGDGHIESIEQVFEELPIEDLWPKIDGKAFQGLARDVARTFDPFTEADPIATLVQFLAAFGNLIGRRPHFTVSKTRHHTVLYAVLVGASGSGRKGTSWDLVYELMKLADPDWAGNHVVGGLSSGEGLIHCLDKSQDDARLLAYETEFVRVLKAASREASTLSAVLRQAFDSGNLAVLTKN